MVRPIKLRIHATSSTNTESGEIKALKDCVDYAKACVNYAETHKKSVKDLLVAACNEVEDAEKLAPGVIRDTRIQLAKKFESLTDKSLEDAFIRVKEAKASLAAAEERLAGRVNGADKEGVTDDSDETPAALAEDSTPIAADTGSKKKCASHLVEGHKEAFVNSIDQVGAAEDPSVTKKPAAVTNMVKVEILNEPEGGDVCENFNISNNVKDAGSMTKQTGLASTRGAGAGASNKATPKEGQKECDKGGEKRARPKSSLSSRPHKMAHYARKDRPVQKKGGNSSVLHPTMDIDACTKHGGNNNDANKDYVDPISQADLDALKAKSRVIIYRNLEYWNATIMKRGSGKMQGRFLIHFDGNKRSVTNWIKEEDISRILHCEIDTDKDIIACEHDSNNDANKDDVGPISQADLDALKAKSRVIIYRNLEYWNATIMKRGRDKMQGRFLIHFDGNKRTVTNWVKEEEISRILVVHNGTKYIR